MPYLDSDSMCGLRPCAFHCETCWTLTSSNRLSMQAFGEFLKLFKTVAMAFDRIHSSAASFILTISVPKNRRVGACLPTDQGMSGTEPQCLRAA